MKKKRVSISFLGNALFDSRVVNLTHSLLMAGYEVDVTSFDWQTIKKSRSLGNTKIYKLTKGRTSLLFYAKFIMLLLYNLIKKKADYYIVEDVFCLPFVYYAAKFYKKPFYYNSRELYPFLAGLRNKKKNQSVIASIEKKYIYGAAQVMTTGPMDADFIREYYGMDNVLVLRNLPRYRKPETKVDLRKMFGLSPEQKILIYQGVVLEGRGIIPSIDAIKDLENFVLVIAGEGPFRKKFEKYAEEKGVNDWVFFTGMIPNEKLIEYTSAADAGLALIENISKSYYYALPNKLFEYIMAGIPVICSNLPQMDKVVSEYNAGRSIDLEIEGSVKEAVLSLFSDPAKYELIRKNCEEASLELNWEAEFSRVKDILFP